MAQSIRERTSELGVLKTVGFTDATVMALVLGEAFLLVGGAGILGLVLAKLGTPVFGKLVESFLPVFYLPAGSVLVGLGIAALLGLASGGVPAFVALRLSIVDALGRR
jgi:putative ABC transport system permease protein